MARLPRLTVPGYPHHIIQRGNNRQAIVADRADYELLLALIDEHARDNRVALHAYVVMSNHFHLLATPETAEAIPQMMQAVGRRYVRRFDWDRAAEVLEGHLERYLADPSAYGVTGRSAPIATHDR